MDIFWKKQVIFNENFSIEEEKIIIEAYKKADSAIKIAAKKY